jgi:hypothetical protein
VEAQTTLASLPVEPAATIEDAIARMEAIDGRLPVTDGLACFNRMYLIVTRTIYAQVGSGFYADPAFMARLDVTFANRYLAAVEAYRAERRHAPRAWRVLLDCRADPDLAPLQFALAGMNAHINFDLAPAVTQTCTDLGTPPDRGSHHADYIKVNQTLDALDTQIRQSFEDGVLLEIDREFPELADLAGGFSMTAAREAAWVNAEVLWRLRDDRLLARSYLTHLDRTVGFAGRALLVRLPRR